MVLLRPQSRAIQGPCGGSSRLFLTAQDGAVVRTCSVSRSIVADERPVMTGTFKSTLTNRWVTCTW